jgi:hypothetical protein
MTPRGPIPIVTKPDRPASQAGSPGREPNPILIHCQESFEARSRPSPGGIERIAARCQTSQAS